MTDSSAPVSRLRTSDFRLITVFLVVMVDLMGFGIVLPLLPFYAGRFQASPFEIGLLYSIYSLAQLFFSPIWGSLSDRIGRRPVMLLSTFGSSLSYLLFAFSDSLGILFFSRLAAGVMGGNLSAAQAAIADVTGEKDRARGMALLGAAFGIGFMFGPAAAGALLHPRLPALVASVAGPVWCARLSAHAFVLPGLFAALLSSLSFLLVLLKLPETAKKNTASEGRSRGGIFSRDFWSFIARPRATNPPRLFLRLLLCVFLVTVAEASLYGAFPLFCEKRLGMTPLDVTKQFIALGLVAVLVQGGLMRPLTKRFPEEGLYLAGSILIIAGLVLLPFAPGAILLGTFLGIMTVGTSLSRPTLQSMISKQVSESEYGSAMGASQALAGLGRVLGPAWGGFLFGLQPRLPFLATAAVLFLAVALRPRSR